MKKKKNKFFTMLCSFLPGAAEMYMGFMKYGVSLMGLFFLSIMIPSVLRLSDAFIMLAVLVWFYGFFHARTLATYDEGPLDDLRDKFIWEDWGGGLQFEITSPVLRKWASVVLIVIGVVMLWGTLENVLYQLIPHHLWDILSPVVDMVPQVVVSALMILIGVKLIQGKRETLKENGREGEK